MLTIPTQFQAFRGVLLGILCISTIINSWSGEWVINKSIFIFGIYCVFCSIFFIGYGVLNDTPGALSVITVFVLWPIVYIYLMGNDFCEKQYLNYIKTIIIGSVAVCLIEILALSEGYGLINFGVLDFFDGSIGIYEGRTELFLMNSATLIYSMPMSLCILMMPNNLNRLTKNWNILNTLSIFLSLLCISMIGRRSILVVVMISPILILVVFKISLIKINIEINKIILYSGIFIILIFFVFYYFDLDLNVFIVDFFQAFGFDSSSSDRRSSGVRGEQFFALIEGWMMQPILGYGHGAGVATSVRSSEAPWTYELTYIALLFQVGILGFLIYFFAILWYLVKSIILVRVDRSTAFLILPLLVGSIEFLIASATNPYLLKFDYLWTIFFSVAVLNFYLLHRKQKT